MPKLVFMKKWFTNYIVLLVLICEGVYAQDPQFSQYYASPIYHNPAFAGGAHAPRLIANYRNQWSSLGSNFVTSTFSVDNYFERLNSGVSLLLLSDSQGAGRLKTTEISGQYAYQIRLNDKNYLRLGTQATYLSRSIDNSTLTFGDQYYDNGKGLNGNASTDPLAISAIKPIHKPDFSTGALFYNQKTWLGLAVNHLARPIISASTVDTTRLYTKWTVSGGFNIPLANLYSNSANMEREFTLSPTFLLKKQGGASQLDAGLYLTYTPLTLGAWYRGIPIKRAGTTSVNHDAVILLVGYRLEKLSIGYSYDLTISKLGPSTGGTHEISIAYLLNPIETDRPSRRHNKKELSCPKF